MKFKNPFLNEHWWVSTYRKGTLYVYGYRPTREQAMELAISMGDNPNSCEFYSLDTIDRDSATSQIKTREALKMKDITFISERAGHTENKKAEKVEEGTQTDGVEY